MNNLIYTLIVGIGATAVMDVWGITRKVLLNGKAPDYGMVGRWLGHMASGTFTHEAIAKSPPIRGERAIGWTAHYLTGITFAAILQSGGMCNGFSRRHSHLHLPLESALYLRRSC